MNFWSRIKFILGILGVLLLVFGLVLYLENMLSSVRAQQAELAANSTSVGVDYPGLVTSVNVGVDDKVTKGETLFVIQSPQLTTDIANHTVNPSTLPFSLDKSGNILVKANSSGVVQQINYTDGSYVPGGAVMATIYASDNLFVTASFQLSPPDYARVNKGSVVAVTYPDDNKAQAVIYNIAITQNGGKVDTVVEARLTEGASPHFPVGTPVQATLKLRSVTWWEDMKQAFNKLFKPKAG